MYTGCCRSGEWADSFQAPGANMSCSVTQPPSWGTRPASSSPLSRGLPELCWPCVGQDRAWIDSPGQHAMSWCHQGHSSPAWAQQRRWNWILEEKLVGTWGGKQKRYPSHLNYLWGLLKWHVVFCFTHGEAPRFTAKYMRKRGLTNPAFKEITAKIIAFW